MKPIRLETERLVLRQWRSEDLIPLHTLCSDMEVMRYFPNVLSKKESQEMLERGQAIISNNGWGFWAAELKSSQELIGFVGIIELKPDFSFAPGIEIGWRLARPFWGKGLATEAVSASLEFAFNRLDLEEVVAFTTVENHRSQKLMQRLSMKNTGSNFLHPMLPGNHPLAEHVLYKITKPQWLKSSN